MGLLGSMVAGAVSGGAKARQAQLMEEIDAKRKESFLKLQQEYAQENAQFSNDLAMKSDEKAFDRNERAQLGQEIRQNAWEEERTDSDREWTESQQDKQNEFYLNNRQATGSGAKPTVKQNEDGSFSVYDPETQTAKTVHTEESATAKAEQDTAMWAAEQGKGFLNSEPSKEQQKKYFDERKSMYMGGGHGEQMVTVSQGGKTYQVPRSMVQQGGQNDGVVIQPQPLGSPQSTQQPEEQPKPQPAPQKGLLPERADDAKAVVTNSVKGPVVSLKVRGEKVDIPISEAPLTPKEKEYLLNGGEITPQIYGKLMQSITDFPDIIGNMRNARQDMNQLSGRNSARGM